MNMKWQVRELIDIVKKYKKTIFFVLVMVIVANIFNILAPYLLKMIIDEFAENMLISSIISILKSSGMTHIIEIIATPFFNFIHISSSFI